MALSAKVLFDTPRRELSSTLRAKLEASAKTQIVTGFATVEGMASIETAISGNPLAVDAFIVGAGTYRAFDAFERMTNLGVPQHRLRVHLGHTRLTRPDAHYKFYRYHPMLHSKVYYMEHSDGTASAVVGSHNVTGFALLGLNGEAAVLLEGEKSHPEFEKIRSHIAQAAAESLPYSAGMREAFAWWAHEFLEGLADKADDAPREGEGRRTIVILCEAQGGLPKKNDRIYFELPRGLGKVSSLKAEVHVYVFEKLPSSPSEALACLDSALASYWCRAVGLEEGRGGVELRAEWQLSDLMHPLLQRTPKPFRPRPCSDMQQVRVQVYNKVIGKFLYSFGPNPTGWIPEIDPNRVVRVDPRERNMLKELDLIPAEDQEWFLVNGLSRLGLPTDNKPYLLALERLSPKAGAYVLMSLRRKEVDDEFEGKG
jgi:hypothetical protein